MVLGGDLDKDQNCTIISIADFGREANIVKGFDELFELCFGLCFACLLLEVQMRGEENAYL